MFKLSGFDDMGAQVLLQRCLDCPDNARFHQLLEKLVRDHATPLFRSAIAAKLSDTEERESVYGEATKRFADKVTLLRARRGHGLPLHSDPKIAEARKKLAESSADIREFGPFCRMLARQAFSDYLEEKRPERRRLGHRLRFLFEHQPTLIKWSAEGEVVCGWSEWRQAGATVKASSRLVQLEKEPKHVAEEVLKGQHPDQVRLAFLVGSLLLWIGHPIPFQTLVDALIDILSLHEPVRASGFTSQDENDSSDAYSDIADPAQDVEQQLQARAALQLIWERIRVLPLAKRRALLLGMRGQNGESALKMMPSLHVAGHREIAEALEMPWEEFAKLWAELPLDDARIAQLAQTTANNVRVQRHDARERLAKQNDETGGLNP